MIVRVRWRHDGAFGSVLFVGTNPHAEVSTNRGKPGFLLSLNLSTGLRHGKFKTRDEAMQHAEQAVDAVFRERLTKGAREALENAGL